MATVFNINIADDTKANRMINGIAQAYNYQANIPDPAWVNPFDGTTAPLIPNPQTKKNFVVDILKRWMKEVTRSQEMNTAAETARLAADTIGEV